jgi:CBS domain-containing protein
VVVVGANGTGRVDVVARDGDGPSAVPVVERDRSLQDALALMLEAHSAWVAVADGGRYLGLLGIDNLYNDEGRARE